MEIHFALPLYFILAGLFSLLLIFWQFFSKNRAFRLDLGFWQKRVKMRSRRVWLLYFLIILVSLLFSVALANPQMTTESRTVQHVYGKPVMVVMDVSGSMTSEYQEGISKFQKTRDVFYEIIQHDSEACFGLLVYSESSYIARDFICKREFWQDTLEKDKEIARISGGTETAVAIVQAQKYLLSKVQARDRAMILISDLEDIYPAIAGAISVSMAKGIKVYVIVIEGDQQLAQERITSIKEFLSGQELIMVLAGDGAGLDSIFQEISKMENAVINEEVISLQKSLAPQILMVILGLTFLSLVLSETIFRKIP